MAARPTDSLESAESVAPPRQSPLSALHTITLRSAAELARGGKHDAALKLLTTLGAERASLPSALDLTARIHAQEGRYQEAENLWKRAVELVPTNAVYRQALRRAHRITSGAIPRLLATPWFTLGISLIAVVVLLTMIGTLLQRGRTREEASSVAAAPARIASSPEPLLFPEIPGLVGFDQRIEGSAVLFIPDSGLFVSGSATLTARASALLSALAEKLEPYRDSIEIEIVGYTDEVPMITSSRFRDNAALAMARAVAVYEYLRSATGVFSTHVSARSGGEATLLFPGTDTRARARKRTVVLRIVGRP